MLTDSLEKFISHRRIDSYQKVWFLMFLHQHTSQQQLNREYVRRVTFTDTPALDEAIEELQEAGLLLANGELLRLDEAPDIRQELDALVVAFADPTARQELLRKLYTRSSVAM